MKWIALGVVLLVGACSVAKLTEQTPDRIVVEGGGADKGPLVEAEARKGCAAYGRRPVLIYSECTWWNCDAKRYVYDCVE